MINIGISKSLYAMLVPFIILSVSLYVSLYGVIITNYAGYIWGVRDRANNIPIYARNIVLSYEIKISTNVIMLQGVSSWNDNIALISLE